MIEDIYPEGVSGSEHIAHDMRSGRFPKRSTVEEFLRERAAALASAQPAAVAGDDRREKALALGESHFVDGLTDEDIGLIDAILALFAAPEAAKPIEPGSWEEGVLQVVEGALEALAKRGVTRTDVIAAAIANEVRIELASVIAAPEAAALERAADIADGYSNYGEGDGPRIARAIRALKPAAPARLYTEAAARSDGEVELVTKLYTLTDELKDALAPFARSADDLGDEPDQTELWEHSAALDITAGHLRRAKTVHAAAIRALPPAADDVASGRDGRAMSDNLFEVALQWQARAEAAEARAAELDRAKDAWHSRAMELFDNREDLRRRLSAAVEALKVIGDMCPETQEMTLAHTMADVATAALVEVERAEEKAHG